MLAAGCASSTAPIEPAPSPGEMSAVPAPRPPVEMPTSVACTHEAWSFASYPGVLITTPFYRIHTTIGYDRVLGRLPLFLECALLRYTSAFGPLPLPAERMDTFIFRDRRQWSAKTRQILPDQAGSFQNLGRGGFTTRGTAVLYYIDWSGRDRDTFAIAAHEGWHQYTQTTFRHPLPIWLEEGIATYMEGYRFRRSDEAPEFQPWRNWERRRVLREALDADRMIPLQDLLAYSPQDFLEDGKGRLLTYYAQVWALTRFLVEGEEGRHLPALEQVLQDAAAGRLVPTLARSPAVIARGGRAKVYGARNGPWVIYAYFTTDLAALDEAYVDYARTLIR